MPTLADMKARIADEIFRDDLGTAIAREIDSAIRFYQPKRLYFAEKYNSTFDTVIGKAFYGPADDTNFGNLVSIDSITVVQNGTVTSLKLAMPDELEVWSTPFAATGAPFRYAYYDEELRLYLVPDQVYPIRIMGVIPVAGPLDDATDGNPWMYDAEELIRSRAKRNLYLHSLGDVQMAQVMKSAEDEAFDTLQRETSSRAQVHRFRPWCV